MHVTDKEAGNNSPARPHPPLQQPLRGVDAQFETFRLLVLEFENWLTAHEKEASRRLELGFRISSMKTFYTPYFKLLIDQADVRYFELTRDFRDRYYEVIARAEMALESEPLDA